MSKREVSSPNAPQLAQLIQSRLHAFDSSRIGLRPTVPAQCLPDLLEPNFAAHRPFQHVRSDLADGLRGLPVSLPMITTFRHHSQPPNAVIQGVISFHGYDSRRAATNRAREALQVGATCGEGEGQSGVDLGRAWARAKSRRPRLGPGGC